MTRRRFLLPWKRAGCPLLPPAGAVTPARSNREAWSRPFRHQDGPFSTFVYVNSLKATLFGMMMSPPCCDWLILLSVNPTPDWFDYLKQRKRWTGDSNLATVSVFTLSRSLSPRLCLSFIAESCDSSSLLSLPLSFPPFLPLLRSGGKKGKVHIQIAGR